MLTCYMLIQIIEGERLTLTLWFSRDSAHDEDAKLISLLSENILYSSNSVPGSKLFPVLASSNMYWFSPESVSSQLSGFDICCARILVLGFDIYSSKGKSSFSDFTELLTEPVQLARGNELFEREFVNILHLLQVVQFYYWKASELLSSGLEVEPGEVIQVSQSQQEKINILKSLVQKDHQLPEMVFGCVSFFKNLKHSFDWEKFSAAIASWEDYTCRLHKDLLMSLPYWRTQQIIYSVQFEDT
ncbi:uncharacterized protein LOC105634172 [Jatropha curcas]|uniref:uncharacterized protein LOC105634172 n=1 Tax=Jatropha curcas TaxID=180498 RepID=UPI0018963C15|nr:uncharacterized protein LOC105634172 [Jatropha curcas]